MAKSKDRTPPKEKITRDDIEASFRALEPDAQDLKQRTQNYAVAGGVALGVALILLAFLLGRKRGTRKSTVVEIRRI